MADLGIHFISVDEGIDTSTDSGWSQFTQYVTFSEREWRRIAERTSAGRELKISYGGWPGGPAPYGYTSAKDTSWVGRRRKEFSVLVTDEHESMVLAVAVELITDQGASLTKACDELNKRKLFTRSGVPWTVGNLRNRLYSETIHNGYVVYRKTDRGSGRNTTLRHDDGTPVHGDQLKIGVPRHLQRGSRPVPYGGAEEAWLPKRSYRRPGLSLERTHQECVRRGLHRRRPPR